MALGMGRMLSGSTKGIIIAEAAVVCGRRNYSEDCYFCNSGMLQLHTWELIILQSLAHLFLKKAKENVKMAVREEAVVWCGLRHEINSCLWFLSLILQAVAVESELCPCVLHHDFLS